MTTSIPAVRTRRPWTDWLGAAFVAVMWAHFILLWLLDVESFVGFMAMMGTYLVMTLLFAGWWFTRRSFSLGRRFLVPAVALLLAVLVGVLSRRLIQPPAYIVLLGLPLVLAAWALWVPLTLSDTRPRRVGGLLLCIALCWSMLLLIRVNGTHGNMRADMHWRWSPTAEQLYLSEAHRPAGTAAPRLARALELQSGDWPGFRGPDRDGIAHGSNISLDWAKSPPTVLWRQRVGPGWSSMAVVDHCVFTQEQRGEHESVVCRDADSGREIWAHDDAARFDEAMAGPGPRATPTFAGGRIYSQGATGTLDCLDAATGRLIWSRDIRADAGAAVPMWGFCASPLVVDNRVVIFAGGEGKKGLLSYSLDGGTPLWTADAGKTSYASPQLFNAPARQQVLMFTSEGFFSVDPATGQAVWQFPVAPAAGVPAVVQACRLAPDAVALGHGAGFGLQRVALDAGATSATRAWVTRQMKPSFSDMVYHDGFIYGFDNTVFCCIDASTGARRWRDGRYGAGQVILLADQGVMLVSTEDGAAVLLRCNPSKNEELGRVATITGKGWNHPAFAANRLYVRSDAEMACLQLGAGKTP